MLYRMSTHLLGGRPERFSAFGAPGSNLHSWCFSFSAMRFAIMLMVE